MRCASQNSFVPDQTGRTLLNKRVAMVITLDELMGVRMWKVEGVGECGLYSAGVCS